MWILLVRGGLDVVIMGVLLMVLVQDWRWRGVYWYLFPVLATATVAARLLTQSDTTVLLDALPNLAFVAINLLAVVLYVRVRFGTADWLQYLGLGDVLFWLCAALACAPLTFVVYFLGSLLVAAGVFVAARGLLGDRIQPHVPLAGLQAGCMVIWLVASWLLLVPPLSSDEWLLMYLPV